MKRMRLMVDEKLPAQCVSEFEAETNSEVVTAAITEVFRVREIRKIRDYFENVGCEGKLSNIRKDDPPRRRAAKSKKSN